MENRDSGLLSLRGGSLGELHKDSSREERFQNNTIRPVLKLQNDILIASFINYINKSKADFYNFSTEKKLHFIENAIHKDIKFRNALKGMIIAMFTIEEFGEYIMNSSALNKRMMNLLIERLKDQVQLLVNG